MAKKPTQTSTMANGPTKTNSTEARALVDLPQHGAKAGEAFEAPQEVIASLVAAGEADAHPDAVKHAKA